MPSRVMHEFLIYVRDPERSQLTESVLPPATIMTANWMQFCQSAEHANAVAVVLPDLGGPRTTDLMRFHADRPFLPIVLITEVSAENMAPLNQLPEMTAVLPLEHFASRIYTTLTQASETRILARAARLIENMSHLDPLLAATTVKACRAQRPTFSVHWLAADVMGYSAKTLRQHWTRSAARHSTPHDFIDWLLIVHAVTRWRPGRSHRRIAKDLAVDRHRLARALQRRFEAAAMESLAADRGRWLLADLEHLLRSAEP